MSTFSQEISQLSLVKVIAYIHHYTIPYLSKRGMHTNHLRQLSNWIESPKTEIRTICKHKQLAAHLALLQAANLIAHDQSFWQTTPFLHLWLNLPTHKKYQQLLDAIAACRWKQTIDDERWHDCLDEAYGAFLFQALSYQQERTVPSAQFFSWKEQTELSWLINMPTHPPLDLLFHILQIGDLKSSFIIEITPLTLHRAQKQGYSLNTVEHLLTQATKTPLNKEQKNLLITWYKRGNAYKLQTVHLLTTAQPEQMQKISQNGRLRRKIIQQLSPRHAIVQADIQQSLHRWGNKQQFPLNTENIEADTFEAGQYHWLGLQLLSKLTEFSSLRLSMPAYLTEQVTATIPPDQIPQLEHMVQTIVQNIHQAIRGQDALLPPIDDKSDKHLTHLQQAIAKNNLLKVKYQALGAVNPSWRKIQPLMLQTKGALHYLTAYCHRAEMNLTFRVDRITEIEEVHRK